ncbi:MAG TPA: carboxypeptidase-like regulatory domain-containing protein [Candidatus Paceibacterota bacterium]|nr:carboxypeptidase-like regulatory domain-containing protein [Candidatus Paceibacterota bacterium]
MARRFPSACGFCVLVIALFALSALAHSIGRDTTTAVDSPAVALQTPGTGTVNVTVRDDAERPLQDAAVTIAGLPGEWRTKADGNVSIPDVPANVTGVSYNIAGNKTRYENGSEFIVVHENRTTNVTIELRGGIITGIVTDSSGRHFNATISIAALGLSAKASYLDGSYEMRGVPGGTHSVTAAATGYVSQNKDIYLPVGDFVLVNFVLLSQNGSISGHVFNAVTEVPIANASVSVLIGSVTLTVATDVGGGYNITSVPEGTYSVTASKQGFFPETVTNIEVTRGNRTEGVDFHLQERPTTLSGVVRSGTLLVVGVNVTIEGTTYYNISGSDGSYVISNLTAGTYTVVVIKAGYATQTISDLVIVSGTETVLNIDLVGLPGAILRGVVYLSDSQQPLTNVQVTIIDLRPQPRSTSTNINGEFEFTGLLAGNYTIRLEKTGYRPLEIGKIDVVVGDPVMLNLELVPLREGFEGFIFGFDMAHSMMILALFLTIVILAVAVYLRMRSFQTPGSAPAVYDEADEEPAGGEVDGSAREVTNSKSAESEIDKKQV